MAPALQRAPEPSKRAASYYAAARTEGDGGGGGGTPPQSGTGGLETQPKNDSKVRSALHRLVFVLPLSLLILQQALLHQNETIELPLVALELKVHEVVPIFLMLISFMLYCAMRYARITLWNVTQRPQHLSEIGQIALDDTEAYKVKSAYYEDVLDPMAAALIPRLSNFRTEPVKYLVWLVLFAFNIVRSWLVYVLILLILAVMAFYVTSEFITVLLTLNLDALPLHWPFKPSATIEALILCLTGFLMLLGWLNAAATVLIAVWPLLLGVIFLLVRCLRLLSRIGLFAPLNPVFRSLHSSGMWLREKRRDRALAKQLARYLRRQTKFLDLDPRVAEFRVRQPAYRSLWVLEARYRRIEAYFGRRFLPGGANHDNNSEWGDVIEEFDLLGLNFCIGQLEILCHLEPLDLLERNWPKLRGQVEGIIVSYENSPDDALLAILKKETLSACERHQAAEAVKARNLTIESHADEISQLRDDLSIEISRLVTGKAVRDHVRVDEIRLMEQARRYFRQTEVDVAEFREAEPVRGERDSRLFTALLRFLARAGGLADIPNDKPT